MLGLRKKPFNGREKNYSVVIDKFSLAQSKSSGGFGGSVGCIAEESVNCDCRDGIIRTGLGLEVQRSNGYAVFGKSDAVRFFVVDTEQKLDNDKDTQLYCLRTNGEVQAYDPVSREYTHVAILSPISRIVHVSDEDGYKGLLASGEDKYYIRQFGFWVQYPMDNANGTICVCKDRVFLGLNKKAIAYSDPAGLWNFGSSAKWAGKLYLDYDFGEIVSLLCFENRVYAFHQFGVVRLEVDGDASKFKVQPLDYTGGEIYGDSVGVCGNSVFFLAADGVYRFDGKKFARVDFGLAILPSTQVKKCEYGVCGDKYLVQYTDYFGQERGVAIAADGKSGYFTDVRTGLSQCGGLALCVADGYVCALSESGPLGGGESYEFTTQRTDFGVRGRKTLKCLRFEGDGFINAYVYVNGFVKSEWLQFQGGVATMDLRAVGDTFYFTFLCEKDTCIRRITASFSTAECKENG